MQSSFITKAIPGKEFDLSQVLNNFNIFIPIYNLQNVNNNMLI